MCYKRLDDECLQLPFRSTDLKVHQRQGMYFVYEYGRTKTWKSIATTELVVV